MSDIKLFSLKAGGAEELLGTSANLEKELQRLVEANMESLLGVRFLATEHSTGNTHKGRIDSLGLDENNCPVIIEYKRDKSGTVINQGLFYLDWLAKNPADFKWLVMDTLGRDAAEQIEWSGARLLCIAADFPKYDLHAVEQINANIELIRYRYFGEVLLLLELVNSQSETNNWNQAAALSSETDESVKSLDETSNMPASRKDTHQDRKDQASPEHLALYDQVCEFALSLGDEVQRKELKLYTAFKLIKNFACVMVWSPVQAPAIRIYLRLNPDDIELEPGFTADVSNKGHWGTGDLEVTVKNNDDLEKAKPLIEKSYASN